jgi:hypothetical protein
MQFGAGVLISPKVVAAGQRPVGDSGHPIAFAAGLKCHRTLRVVESRDPAGRILIAVILIVLRPHVQGALQHQQYGRQENSDEPPAVCLRLWHIGFLAAAELCRSHYN